MAFYVFGAHFMVLCAMCAPKIATKSKYFPSLFTRGNLFISGRIFALFCPAGFGSLSFRYFLSPVYLDVIIFFLNNEGDTLTYFQKVV